MLFNVPELRSFFELEYDLEDKYANLNCLAEEISRITNLLYVFYKENEVVRFYYKANNDTPIFVDFHNVSDKIWFRSIAEIKEILYRYKVNNVFQKQFSLNKALESFGIKEPKDEDEYKKYLQLLYLFYIINYFAFPKKNIFKILKREHRSYLTTYDNGLEEGIYLSFIMSNLLNGVELNKFICKTNEISKIMDLVSMKFSLIDVSQDHHKIYHYVEEMIEYSIRNIGENLYSEDIVESAIDYFQNYAMSSYSLDLLLNLTKEKDLFKFDEVEIGPPDSWKQKYVSLVEIDEFLYSDELIMFCKQSLEKLESRDKIKFNSSNSIKFLKKLISYDKEWIETFGENDGGLLIEIEDGNPVIYALRIAVILKTYNDLINKLQIKIASKNEKHMKPLRSLLSTKWNLDDIFPPTLGIRFFMLAAHAQYLNVTKEEYYFDFVDKYLFPEILNMMVFNAAYEFNSYEETKEFLLLILEML